MVKKTLSFLALSLLGAAHGFSGAATNAFGTQHTSGGSKSRGRALHAATICPEIPLTPRPGRDIAIVANG